MQGHLESRKIVMKACELKRLGFDARLIGQNRYGLHQVVFESYNTRKEAENALMKIKKTQDKTAWLLFKRYFSQTKIDNLCHL